MIRFLLIAAVVWFVWRAVQRYLQQHLQHAAKPQNFNHGRGRASKNPHEVLGVPTNASPEQIRTAYQALVKQYHPDRLDNMAPELRAMAEARTKEITEAYNSLKRRHS